MMRPIHPSHRAILAALAERGPSVAQGLGVGIASDVMHILVGRGWINRITRTNQGRNSAWLYDVTELGRQVLAVGQVPKLVQAPNIEMKRSESYWRNQRPEAPSVTARHVHYWLVENDLAQSARCRTCGSTKQFRPVALGMATRSKVTYA